MEGVPGRDDKALEDMLSKTKAKTQLLRKR